MAAELVNLPTLRHLTWAQEDGQNMSIAQMPDAYLLNAERWWRGEGVTKPKLDHVPPEHQSLILALLRYEIVIRGLKELKPA